MPDAPRSSPTTYLAAATRLFILGGILAGFAVRLHRLGAESLWYDETVSAYLSGQALPALIAHTAADIHPPAYYILLHAWRALLAPSLDRGFEFLLAFPSLWFGVVSIGLLTPLARKTLSAQAAAPAVWLAAFSPFLVWYSQEVRMYTVAATLGLLCLYAAIHFTSSSVKPDRWAGGIRPAQRWLGVYVLAATAGLYTLYYTAFALIAINLAVFWTFWIARNNGATHSRLRSWLLAQIGVVVLFLPWLPYAIRQVVEPPVPVWRLPWSDIPAVSADLAQSLAALLVGQSVPPGHIWGWMLAVLLLGPAYFRYTKAVAPNAADSAVWLALYLIGPLALIFLISAAVTPIYHVRYLAVYAPAYSLIVAGATLYFRRRSTALCILVVSVLAAGSAYSLVRFWTHPDYAADDHRGAVQHLAAAWRPGDAVLVNAGWVYTAVETYWPRELDGPDDVRPASLATRVRLPQASQEQSPSGEVSLFVTGSLDGPASLGWGRPDADFFSMSKADALSALAVLHERGHRIWHYRLYDTVSDPEGELRAWLAAHMQTAESQPYKGRDYLRLELYEPDEPLVVDGQHAPFLAAFESTINLLNVSVPERSPAGEYLYVPLTLRAGSDGIHIDAALAASLRLVDADGMLWAQHDQPLPAVAGMAPDSVRVETLTLPVLAATPPNDYALQLVIYRQDTLAPLSAILQETGETAPSLSLGSTTIDLPESMPRVSKRPLAVFDYIELLRGKVTPGALAPGHSVLADLLWHPRPNAYADDYTVRFELVNGGGEIVQYWRRPLGGERNPSGGWTTGYPVRDLHTLQLAADLSPGDYTLSLSIERAADGLRIPATAFFLPISRPAVELGTLHVESLVR